jgi:serine/threonine-protein kinase HipA
MQNHNNPASVNTRYLWYLGKPEYPILVGDLNLVMSARGVSLKYDAGWLRTGFPLSEDLPLVDIEYLPREKDTAVGAIDDARPGRWGEKVIRLLAACRT